jgi:membrane protease YdiL (CAAX protease family)
MLLVVATAVQESVGNSDNNKPTLSSLNLLSVSGIILTIAIIWRVVDQFILGLGNTWMNIMPSKLFPLLILIGYFWTYKQSEIESVLGLSRRQLRVQILAGVIMVLLISIAIDIGSIFVYASFIDPKYPLEFHVLNQNLLGYTFLFFLTNALFEETLFRGLLQNSLKTHFSANRAILLSAAVFGIWHAGWPLVNGSSGTALLVQVSSMVFFTTILGLLFGVYYERFSSGQSLVGPIIAHTFFNFIGESFKIGPEPVIQGPDIVFSTPGLMTVSVLMFLIVFVVLFLVFWRYRIEQVTGLWNYLQEKTARKRCSAASAMPSENDKQTEV